MMKCPVCGRPVIMIFHEWHDVATFEYFHLNDEGEPCHIELPYNEGIERYEREWNEMMGSERIDGSAK